MVTEYYMDLQDDTGHIGITGIRCSSCGEVIDPVILRNRLNQTPDLLHVVKRRTYSQRVGHGESDGQNQKGRGMTDRLMIDHLLAPPRGGPDRE